MNIVFLGDSLIEYFDWQDRLPDHRVFNLGMAGESVEGLLSRVMKIPDRLSDADRIFIMCGINNVAMGDLGFIDFFRVIIEKLSSFCPGVKISVHSLPPTDVSFISESSILKVNEALRELARDQGVQYLDLHSKFIDTEGNVIREYLMDDGVHLSRTGYEVWLRMIVDVISS